MTRYLSGFPITRRSAVASLAALTAATSLTSVTSVHPVLAGSLMAPAPQSGELRPFPAQEAPFDSGSRRNLALDLLSFFVRQQGLFPGRGAFLLPAAPWFGGWEPRGVQRVWDISVPAGVPLYLLAAADPDGRLDASLTTVSINGTPLSGLDSYMHGGVPALHAGTAMEHAVLDLVLAPANPGRFRIEVKTRYPEVTPPASPAGEVVIIRGSGPEESTLLYDVTVTAPDALGPQLIRDSAGTLFAQTGAERRRVPNAPTLRFLSLPGIAAEPVTFSPVALATIPEGPPLPELADGMLVRTESSTLVFRLQDGKRTWIANAASIDGSEVRVLDVPVLQSIVPTLADNMLLQGSQPDVYHVDQGYLRKVPDWDWVKKRGLSPGNVIRVSDQIIASLPQSSPHWVTPGGAWMDRVFSSPALGRPMPYRVFLPFGYEQPDRSGQRYPVIYLLHGMGGRFDEWSGYGVEEVANQLSWDGKFPQTILIEPQGGLGYWMNQVGGAAWADYVARDLVAHVDATYRTVARRDARAVGGISMGGHGAIQIGLNNPSVFGILGAHSPSIRNLDTAPAFFGNPSGFARRDPISLVKDATLSPPPLIWVDTGDKDEWKAGAFELHQELLDKGWAHEWHVYTGEHDGWYWGDHIWDYLPFYAAAFARGGFPLYRK